MLDVILGGVTGLIGSVTTAITNYKLQKLKNKHDVDKWKFKERKIQLETEAMKVEAELKMKTIETETEAQVELADTEAYIKGIEEGNKNTFSDKWIDKLFGQSGWIRYISIPIGLFIAFIFGIVDFLKELMRPGLTMYLTAMTTWITWMAWEIMEKHGIEVMSSDQAVAIFQEVTSVVIYLNVSCVTWWFGDRRIAKFLMRLKDGNIKGK